MSYARTIMASHALRRAPVAVGRSFTVSARMGSLKESSSHSDIDFDKHKADSLAKQKAGKGHWKPELASDSEEAVKADRDKTPTTAASTAKLQEKTKKAAEETAKAGTSVRDEM